MGASGEQAGRELTPATMSVYALGELTLNAALASMSLIYASYFLTQVAGLRPALAGLVPLIGRVLDAFTDPLMGRLSDHTRWRAGRRRPYLLLGALPFGASFAMMWVDLDMASEAARFAYYAGSYCLLTTAMTVLAIPYLALVPEMALGYDERTSLSTYRNAGTIFGIVAAVGMHPLAEACGGGSAGFALAGIIGGLCLAAPWPAVYRVTFERPSFRARPGGADLRTGLRQVWRHRSFMQLTAAYLSGRIAMDLISALLILYVTYWIGRSDDFEFIMLLFLATVVASLPVWLRIARGRDKASILIVGTVWWMSASLLFAFAQPGWPRALIGAIVALAGVGYAVVDMMPWAMLGEVIDEDELLTGERRDGLYNGIFTFLRKLGGALGVFFVLGILDLLGYRQGAEQSETTRQAIRFMTVLGPGVFLALAAWFIHGYPLTRVAHARICAALEARRRGARTAGRAEH